MVQPHRKILRHGSAYEANWWLPKTCPQCWSCELEKHLNLTEFIKIRHIPRNIKFNSNEPAYGPSCISQKRVWVVKHDCNKPLVIKDCEVKAQVKQDAKLLRARLLCRLIYWMDIEGLMIHFVPDILLIECGAFISLPSHPDPTLCGNCNCYYSLISRVYLTAVSGFSWNSNF